MRRGTCVKCGTAGVRAAKDGIDLSGERAVGTYLRPNIGPGFRGMVQLHRSELWTFACTNCGYVELYLLDPGAIAFIGQQWLEVTPPPVATPPPPPAPAPAPPAT